MSFRFFRIAVLRSLLACLTLAAGYAGFLYVSGNIHEVERGELYRSGQLSPERLSSFIGDKGIRTVISLRGSHPDEAWFQREVAAVKESGAAYVPIAISARSEPDLARMTEITDQLRAARRPILIHCMGGADRTGLVAALYLLTVDEQTAEEASSELSFLYGHIPLLDGRVAAMDRAFAKFATYWEGGEQRFAENDD